MANQIYPNTGLVEFLKRMANPTTIWKMYTNNVTPTRDSVLGDFTLEGATTPVSLELVPADFTVSGVAAYVGSIIGAPITFLNDTGGPLSRYGYVVMNGTSTILLAACRFDSAPITKGDGESFTITPRLGDFSRFSS